MADVICSVEGCGHAVVTRGWCSKHYQRWRHHGDPLGGGPERELNSLTNCTIEGCDDTYLARGMCGKHYRRWRLYGDPGKLAPPKPPRPAEDRFWEKVEKTDGCWVWKAKIGIGGYGIFWLNGKNIPASRASWMFTNGRPIPDGLWVLHHCDNPPCVNPDHLFLGTAKDNAEDRDAKGRGILGRTLPKRPPKPKVPCSIEGCSKPQIAKGLCSGHYGRAALAKAPECSVEGCDRGRIARGYCPKHYSRWQKYGDPLAHPFKPAPHPKEQGPCEWCGEMFTVEARYDRKQRFCSRQCARKARAKPSQ